MVEFFEEYYDKRVPDEILEGGRYEVAQCDECGFVWQTCVLDDEQTGRLYDSWLDLRASLRRKLKEPLHYFENLAYETRIIGKIFAIPPCSIRVLDFGLGWGQWALMARAFGYEVFGFDISDARKQYAVLNGTPLVESFEEIATLRFHYINLNQVLEHLTAPKQTLRRLADCLYPGGIIYVSVPCVTKSLQNINLTNWKPQKDELHPIEHVNGFNLKNLLMLAAAVGLSPIKTDLFSAVKESEDGLKVYLQANDRK